MKKILIMALTGLTFFNAEAQSTGCSMTKTKKAMHHHDKYAENFKICKNDCGYHVCGEAVSYKNSTKAGGCVPSAPAQEMSYVQNAPQQQDMQMQQDMASQQSMVAPQSQSYPSTFTINNESSYEGYYPAKHYITVTYTDNVAEDNRLPYEGLPSPQDDGPAKNMQRNLNESNPNANLAPITGRRE